MNDVMTVVVAGLVFIIGLFGLALLVDSTSCHMRWEPTKVEYGVFSGCRVFHDGKFVPEDRVRFFEDGK